MSVCDEKVTKLFWLVMMMMLAMIFIIKSKGFLIFSS